MEQAGSSELSLTPVISRLDRLEQLVYDIEEKHSQSGRYTSESSLTLPTEPGKERRPLESVLEEVPVKGSIVERVASLEHRVSKLSVQLEEERLRLKPAILPTPKDCTCNSTAKKKENGLKSISEEDRQEMHEEKAIEDKYSRLPSGCRRSRRRIHHPVVRKRKWLGWLQLGC